MSKKPIQIVFGQGNDSSYQRSMNEPMSLKSMLKKEAQSFLEERKLSLEKIRKIYHSTGQLFEDNDFPANINSIYPKAGSERTFEWLRPHEIHSEPRFISDEADRFDVQQGELGDCWVLAAVASLSIYPQLFEKVVIANQNFEDEYCGAFQFRFWQYGEWVDVIVDDRLPTENMQLIFMRSRDTSEFWTALIEKAYAKLNGSYEALIGGSQSEAFTDFTGGICETIDMTDQTKNNKVFNLMLRANRMSSLMGCSIDAIEGQIEARLPNGLICGHAYSVTDVKEVTVKKNVRRLVRVRNPWGDSHEWRGAYADKSKEWNDFSEDQRRVLGLTFDDDGEFWMSFEDFSTNFVKLEICHLGPDTLETDELNTNVKKSRWNMTLENDGWIKNISAGGCRNFIESFPSNKQFIINVVDADADDKEDKGVVIVGLMQKNMRERKLDFWTIGYAIYKVPNNHQGSLAKRFFLTSRMAAKSAQFINTREVVGRHRLETGSYVIIPSTFNPNEEADYLLRVFSQGVVPSGELEDKVKQENPKVTINRMQQEEEERMIKDMKKLFNDIAGPRGFITSSQLMYILDNSIGKGVAMFTTFGREVARSLVALKDVDMSGRLEFPEFLALWNDFRIWKKIYYNYDVNKDGYFSSFELRPALKEAGFNVDNSILKSLTLRYSDSETGFVSFIDFLLLVCRLKNSFMTFKAQSKDGSGNAVFDDDEYLSYSLYL